MPRPKNPNLPVQMIDAAETMVRDLGPTALSARSIATQVGCAVGAIYREFETLDHLGEAMNVRTLDRLYRRLIAIDLEAPDARFRAIATTYLTFAEEEGPLWRAVFALPRPAASDADQPTPLQLATAPLFVLAEKVVADLIGEDCAPIASRAIWAGLQGIAQLDEEDALNSPAGETAAELADTYVDIVLAGLARQSAK